MSVHLYAIAWNEGAMIGFFLRHYEAFVDRFVIYDDGSTDGTAEILAGHPKVELRRLKRQVPGSLVLSMLAVYQQAWKESRGRADWVIVTNIDEHLHHPDMRGYLAECRRQGVTAIPALGYQMVSDTFPEHSARLSETLRQGASYAAMSKLDIFDPGAIREINYGAGRHQAWPTGNLRWPARDEVLNLHFKYMGRGYTRERHAAMKKGLGRFDRWRRWGYHYLWSDAELEEDWQSFARRTVDIGDPAFEPWQSHEARRWWREPPRERLRGLAWYCWRWWMARRAPLG